MRLFEPLFGPRLPVEARDFADAGIRESWVRDRGMRVFTFVDPTNPLLLVGCFAEDVVPFASLWQNAVVLSLNSTTVRVAAIPDLERRAGRPQDARDIEALEEIQRQRGA